MNLRRLTNLTLLAVYIAVLSVVQSDVSSADPRVRSSNHRINPVRNHYNGIRKQRENRFNTFRERQLQFQQRWSNTKQNLSPESPPKLATALKEVSEKATPEPNPMPADISEEPVDFPEESGDFQKEPEVILTGGPSTDPLQQDDQVATAQYVESFDTDPVPQPPSRLGHFSVDQTKTSIEEEENDAQSDTISNGTYDCDGTSECCAYGCDGGCRNWAQFFTFHGGVQGYKGPRNRGLDGSFGFHEGMNLGIPVPCFHGLGIQLGFEATQSNLSGAAFTADDRNQIFLTTGIYQRTDCGIQAGVVWDYLHDEWLDVIEVEQMRGELSWVDPCGHEIGFRFAANTSHDNLQEGDYGDSNGFYFFDSAPTQIRTTEYYAFFYRFTHPCGGDGQLFGGWSEDGDGLLGGDTTVPITDNWAVRGAFSYLIPDEDSQTYSQSYSSYQAGHEQESWNIGISLVWYPGCNSRQGRCNPYRPLFNVANNGTLFIDHDSSSRGDQ